MKRERGKIVKFLVVILLVIVGAILTIFILDEFDKSVVVKSVKNENLSTIRNDWQGNPVDEKDRFVNEEFPFLPKNIEVLKWTLSKNPQKDEKKNDTTRLEVRDPSEFLQSDRDGILWFGHAAFFIRLNGVSIVTDAAFDKPSFIKPYVDAPSPLGKIKRVDYILISHDHRDHCDETTIKTLTQKFPEAEILAGLKMDELLADWKTPSNKMQTAGWYQQFSIPDNRVKIFFFPTRHWSRRGLFDTNERLWGSFVIQGANKTIYFGSDSGYGVHYKKLGELFPKIDFFLIGIGAYKPRWFMEPNHNSPEDAWQGFLDSKADILIPMHFGRFDLSDEPPSEPLRLLQEKAQETNSLDKIKVLQINESVNLND